MTQTQNKNFTTITLKTAGGPVKIVGKIVRRYTHGYNTKCGGWGYEDISHLGFPCTPAEWILVKEQGKRYPTKINTIRIIAGLPD